MHRKVFLSAFTAALMAFLVYGLTSANVEGLPGVSKTLYVHTGTVFDSTRTTDTTGIYNIDEPVYIKYSAYSINGDSSTTAVYILGYIGKTWTVIDDFSVSTNDYTTQILRTQDYDSLGAVSKLKFATTFTINGPLGTDSVLYYANLQIK